MEAKHSLSPRCWRPRVAGPPRLWSCPPIFRDVPTTFCRERCRHQSSNNHQTGFLAGERREQIRADLFRGAPMIPDADFIHLTLKVFISETLARLFPVAVPKKILTAIADRGEASYVGICRS